MSLTLRPVRRPVEGLTKSAFPEVKRWLKIHKIKELLAPGDLVTFELYAAPVDFVFCELHPSFQPACEDFYNGDGPHIDKVLSASERNHYAVRMLLALEMVNAHAQKGNPIEWAAVRSLINELDPPKEPG